MPRRNYSTRKAAIGSIRATPGRAGLSTDSKKNITNLSYPITMQTTIELPDSLYWHGEQIARAEGFTLEQLIVQAIEREFSRKALAPRPRNRISLPLIHSERPGTLDLSSLNFDDLLA